MLAAASPGTTAPANPSTFMAMSDTWHGQMVVWTAEIGIVLIIAGMFGGIYRLLRGPHLSDRALAVDTIAIQLIGLVILLTIRLGTLVYFDGILVLSLLGFAGTVAIAQYIGRPHMKKKHYHKPSDSIPPSPTQTTG